MQVFQRAQDLVDDEAVVHGLQDVLAGLGVKVPDDRVEVGLHVFEYEVEVAVVFGADYPLQFYYVAV